MPRPGTRTSHSVRELLSLSADYLRRHSVPHPRTEAEWLLAEALGRKRLDLYLSLDETVPEPAKDKLRSFLKKRAARLPRAYVIGYAEFMGLRIELAPGVLVPRPETEILVEVACRLASPSPSPRMADVGTGSGAVACALLHNLPSASLLATDVSPEALDVASGNLRRLGLAERCRLELCEFLPPGDRDLDLVAANLPYVSEAEYERLEPEVRSEPREALVPGPTGLEAIAELVRRAPARLRPGGFIALEVGFGQSEAVSDILRRNRFSDIQWEEDYQGIPRVVSARGPE